MLGYLRLKNGTGRERKPVAYFKVAPIIQVEGQGKNEEPPVKVTNPRMTFETVTSETRSMNSNVFTAERCVSNGLHASIACLRNVRAFNNIICASMQHSIWTVLSRVQFYSTFDKLTWDKRRMQCGRENSAHVYLSKLGHCISTRMK